MSLLFVQPLIYGICSLLCVTLLLYFIFKPERPVHFAGFKMIGIIPGHYQRWMAHLSVIIYDKILQHKDELDREISSPERVEQLLPFIDAQIDEFLRVKLPTSMPMIAMLIGDKTIHQIKEVFVKEIKDLLPKILRQYLETLTTDGKLQAMIEDQLCSTANKAYLVGLQGKCRPLFLRIKLVAFIFGLVFGVLVTLFSTLFT